MFYGNAPDTSSPPKTSSPIKKKEPAFGGIGAAIGSPLKAK